MLIQLAYHCPWEIKVGTDENRSRFIVLGITELGKLSVRASLPASSNMLNGVQAKQLVSLAATGRTLMMQDNDDCGSIIFMPV